MNRYRWLPASATQRAAWELWESKGKSWFARGSSLDMITTTARGGLGIANDLVKRPGLEVDIEIGFAVGLGALATWLGPGLLRLVS